MPNRVEHDIAVVLIQPFLNYLSLDFALYLGLLDFAIKFP